MTAVIALLVFALVGAGCIAVMCALNAQADDALAPFDDDRRFDRPGWTKPAKGDRPPVRPYDVTTPAEQAVTAALLAESCAPGEGILAACIIDGVTTELYGTPVDLARVAVAAVWPLAMEAAAQRIEAEQPTVVTAREGAVQSVAEALFARGQVACEFHGGTLYDECSSCCGLVDELHRDALVAVAAVWPIIAEHFAQTLAARDAS